MDAAQTGYPRNVVFLADIADGRTDELVFRVEDLVETGMETFVADLAGYSLNKCIS